jgi:hypothetical protein
MPPDAHGTSRPLRDRADDGGDILEVTFDGVVDCARTLAPNPRRSM